MSELYKDPMYFEGSVIHEQPIDDALEAWKSHATLQRQAGTKFDAIIDDISKTLYASNQQIIPVPYTTRLWIAQLK